MLYILLSLIVVLLILVIYYLGRINTEFKEINFYFMDKMGFGRDKLQNLENLSHLDYLGYIDDNLREICKKQTGNSNEILNKK